MRTEGSNDVWNAEAMTSPSVQTIQATYRSLERLIGEIHEDACAVDDTLQLASHMLNALGSSADLSGSWLNPITLPIPVAMKAVSAGVSRYVKQRTGFSVGDWTEFVESSRTHVEHYLVELQLLAELARRTYPPDAGPSHIPADQLQQDIERLEDTRRKTAILQPVIARLTKLHQLVHSMLEAAEEEAAHEKPPEPDRQGWRRKVDEARKTLGDTVRQVRDTYQDQIAALLSPLQDLRDRASQLNEQVSALERSLCRLRYLIDLEIAQIRAALGEISPQAAENLGNRVAASVIVPQLKEELTHARGEVNAYRRYLEQLQRRYERGDVGDEVYESLEDEYRVNLQTAGARLSALEAQADVWKDEGAAILRDGTAWLRKQIEVVRARELVGEIDRRTAERRRSELAEEIGRFEDAQNLLRGL
jgi:chromosome segregation ATPase